MKHFSELSEKLSGHIIFMDIDGTLCSEGGTRPTPPALKKLKQLAKKNEIHLCSNSPSKKRNHGMAKICGIPYLDTAFQKPSKEIASLVSNKKKKPLLVIGNLYSIDGRFAKNIGARFIKVKTLLGPKDSLPDRTFFWLDENLISRFV